MKRVLSTLAIAIIASVSLQGCSSAPDPYVGPTPTESFKVSSDQKCS